MDIFQIIIRHNREWSPLEILVFSCVYVLASGVIVKKVKNKEIRLSQGVGILVLFLYLGFTLISTVFGREPGELRYQLELFWSWKVIFGIENSGYTGSRAALLEENLLNMVMLMPVGLLLPIAANKRVKIAYGFYFGLLISASIESLQLILSRGFFEWDDMVHNSLGCAIGVVMMNKLIKNNEERRFAESS